MEKLLDLLNSGLGKIYGFLLFIYDKIACLLGIFLHNSRHFGKLRLASLFKLPCEHVAKLIKPCGLAALSRYNKRSPRLVYKDRIDLVHDGEMKTSLNKLFFIYDHVVPQIIKSKLVIGYICYIAVVRLAPFIIVHAVKHDSDCKPQEFVYLSHPLGVTLGKIIVYRNDMHALALKRVEICRQKACLRLTFSGPHLRDTPLMQNDTAHKLYSVMFRMKNTPRRLPDDRVCLHKQIVKSFTRRQPVFELMCHVLQFGVGFFHH